MANDLNDMKCMRGAACETKWADTTAAINMVVGMTDTTIRWGLKYFANMGTCGVTAGAAVPIGPNNGAAINASIAMTQPGSSTPTRLAVTSGADYLMTVTDPNPKYILLATDGEPNCGPGMANDADDSAGAVAAVMAASTAGIPVFVVGVGNVAPAIATFPSTCSPTRAAARRPARRTGYYPVSSTADLVAVLQDDRRHDRVL